MINVIIHQPVGTQMAHVVSFLSLTMGCNIIPVFRTLIMAPGVPPLLTMTQMASGVNVKVKITYSLFFLLFVIHN